MYPNSITLPSGKRYIPESLYRVRKWGDPIMSIQGFDTNAIDSSNFQAVPLGKLKDGLVSFGATSAFLAIPRADIERLIALQPADGVTIGEKMNWLVGAGRPYFDGDWKTSASIKWGTIVFGGQPVMIDQVIPLTADFPAGDRRKIDFGRLVCFRAGDWGKSPIDYPYLIQRATAAGMDNKYNDAPRGIMYSPVWSPLGWDFAGTWQPDAFYIPMEWLESS